MNLIKFFLQKPALCNSQVDMSLSETVSDLCHDRQGRIVSRECFLNASREGQQKNMFSYIQDQKKKYR